MPPGCREYSYLYSDKENKVDQNDVTYPTSCKRTVVELWQM